MERVAQGAEAILWRDDGILIKERIKKGYRFPELDNRLRRTRTQREAALLREARRCGVNTPLINMEYENKIVMEFVDGQRIKEILNEKNMKIIGTKIGEAVARLHEHGIIHGDLTTSNMILKNGEIFLIDFGLSFRSEKVEDMAVDMWLLYRAIESTHWQILDKIWPIILESYSDNFGQSEKIIKALSRIEKRGRYRERSAIY